MTRPGVIFDLVASNSPSYRGRGIARYSVDFVRAMAKHHPDLVSAVVVHPELGPGDELADLEPWLTTEPDWSSASVLHLSSVFEPEVPVRTFWPRHASANHLLVAATVYDLIPDIFPQWYLEDPGLRRRWRCCREVARTADTVFTLSECARSDTISLLGTPAQRAYVIGSACSEMFRPARSPELAWKTASREVKGLKPRFIVYNGAFNPRKNVDGLVQAYAALPEHLIAAHQLVIVCHASPLERNHYLVMAEQMGLRGRVLVPGYVSDEALVSLYQCTELNVFPSLYEGFGLPVVEAMACGAPTIAGNNSSLVEILPPFALFDASDPAAISESIARALTETPFRVRLCALTRRQLPTWEDVAHRAARVFEAMVARAGRRPPGWRARPALALVGVPAPLAAGLSAYAEVESFHPPGREKAAEPEGEMPYTALGRLDPWRGGYDAVVSWSTGDRAEAQDALQTFGRQWPGRAVIVLAPGDGASTGRQAALEKAGLSVVRAAGPDAWDTTAQRVMAAVAALPAGGGRRATGPPARGRLHPMTAEALRE